MEQEPHSHENNGIVVLPDLMSLRTLIVNVCFVGMEKSDEWVLVDAGLNNYTAGFIIDTAEERFGKRKPKAIILTHGHFDHVGGLEKLLKYWDVPVFAHQLELPYLTGQADYPPGDPSVGGGLMAKVAPLYPHKGINLGSRVQALPDDGSLPGMPGWQWLHTPGHTEGHVSLFREDDRALIAGDAFITVKQESALAVMIQSKDIHGPPMYFTPDWETSWESVKKLEAKRPAAVVTGHGLPMTGEELTEGLETLAHDFDKMAIPDQGRNVDTDRH